MKRRWMRRGRAMAFGWMVAAAGLAVFPRSSSEAQEPDRPSARAALRQKIADLRGDVAIREVEQEIERETLKEQLKRPPAAANAIRSMRHEVKDAGPLAEDALKKGEAQVFLGLVRVASTDGVADDLAKRLEQTAASKDPGAMRKALLAWLEGGEAIAREAVAKEIEPAKQAFARHASELAVRKLELEDLEKQYRDSR